MPSTKLCPDGTPPLLYLPIPTASDPTQKHSTYCPTDPTSLDARLKETGIFNPSEKDQQQVITLDKHANRLVRHEYKMWRAEKERGEESMMYKMAGLLGLPVGKKPDVQKQQPAGETPEVVYEEPGPSGKQIMDSITDLNKSLDWVKTKVVPLEKEVGVLRTEKMGLMERMNQVESQLAEQAKSKAARLDSNSKTEKNIFDIMRPCLARNSCTFPERAMLWSEDKWPMDLFRLALDWMLLLSLVGLFLFIVVLFACLAVGFVTEICMPMKRWLWPTERDIRAAYFKTQGYSNPYEAADREIRDKEAENSRLTNRSLIPRRKTGPAKSG
ncbi:hypothetical protein BJ508DRAFT_327940 [Ascobolus immersus RN42]|uniref:Uncharacterized protein n=1 Tax=Ascobolus immersus RN42 TaxID=1160509 RepID=A0A3N4I3B2_ASCIM|nr:hypothetical protein BJ508DRAFT_327940 [Ascobolus immersus RN42]